MADSFVKDPGLAASFVSDPSLQALGASKPVAPVDPAEQREKGQVLPTGRNWKPPRTALDVILNPQGVPEHLLSIAGSAPLFGMGGQVASQVASKMGPLAQKVAPYVGRTLVGAGESGAASAARGESPKKIAVEAGKGGLATAAMEGLLTKGLDPRGTVRAATQAFEEAKGLPAMALDALRGRLKTRSLFGGGVQLPSTISVPSMSRSKLTVQEAVDQLATLRGPKYQQALKEIEQGMNALDKTKLTPQAGTAFRDMVAPTLKEPTQGIRGAMMGDVGRSIADAAATSPIYGMPALGIAGALLPEKIGDYAKQFVRGLIPR
jgi:hypothetical protein